MNKHSSEEKSKSKQPAVYYSDVKDNNGTKGKVSIENGNQIYDHTDPREDAGNTDTYYDHTTNTRNIPNKTDCYSSFNAANDANNIYDHTNDTSGNIIAADDNEYGAVKATGSDDIYDHTQRGGVVQREEPENYDSMEHLKEMDKNIYDHTNPGKTLTVDSEYGSVE